MFKSTQDVSRLKTVKKSGPCLLLTTINLIYNITTVENGDLILLYVQLIFLTK